MMTTARADRKFLAIIGHLTTDANQNDRALFAFGSAMLAANDTEE